MTNIEMRFYELACTFFNKFIKKEEIDWEQRKWDLVCKLAAAKANATYGGSAADCADIIVRDAETIIAEYKGKTE